MNIKFNRIFNLMYQAVPVGVNAVNKSCSNICWHQGVKAKLFYGNTEFRKLALVGLYHVGVGLSDLFEFCLNLFDCFVL